MSVSCSPHVYCIGAYRFRIRAEDGVVCRPNLAHRLAVKAYQVGGQDLQRKFNDIIFNAAFAEGNDISDTDFLVNTAVEIGLMNREKVMPSFLPHIILSSQAQASEFLRSTECQDCVDKMVSAARAIGVNGVPFIIIDGKWALNGVQPKECYMQVCLASCSSWCTHSQRVPKIFRKLALSQGPPTPLLTQSCNDYKGPIPVQ